MSEIKTTEWEKCISRYIETSATWQVMDDDVTIVVRGCIDEVVNGHFTGHSHHNATLNPQEMRWFGALVAHRMRQHLQEKNK